ncbi:MAG: cyclodeaminase/cyclohydrolase family protein [Eubacterium sp.]|nr:cyclodeaminase/cyclohydrolase family protein [Eubacterium sp.]
MKEKLTERSLTSFVDLMAAKEPVPGGGGAAAAVGALGAALCMMVGNYTTGKKKYAAYEADVQRIMREADALQKQLIEQVNADAEAFEPLSRAYAIPKEHPDREKVLEEATVQACAAPMEMVRCTAKVIDLLDEMQEKGSVMLISDVGCGALLCRAALESAAMNVFINTGSMKNRSKAEAMENEVDALLEKYIRKAAEIADNTVRRIRKN